MDLQMLKRSPHESTRNYVYQIMKQNIMALQLPPGTALSEQEIATALSVSRTPVREAFIRLSQENLLDIIAQRGTYVSLLDLDSVQESKFLRETLEKSVIRLACTHFPSDKLFDLQSYLSVQELCLQENNYLKFYELDEKLHRTIFDGCKKARIWELIQQLGSHYNRVRLLNLARGHDLGQLLEQHKNIVLAIQSRDAALGSRTINQHLNKVRVDIVDLLQDYGSYFKQSESDGVN